MSQSEFSSYPPLFRENNHLNQQNDSVQSLKQVLDSDPIPVIDFQCINAATMDEACRDWGIFRLINHGIPTTLINQLYDHAKRLLAFPFESKQAKFTDQIAYFWGTPALTNKGVPFGKDINWVEGLHVLLGQLQSDEEKKEDPLVASFRCLLEEYGKHMGRILNRVFKTMVMNLGLDPELLGYVASEPSGVLRLYRYPSCSKPDQVPGMISHTDSSTISILNQDEVGGLQILKNDKWLDIEPVTDSLIINLGDMMQAMSNDEYKSVQHKVKLNKAETRISVCYFVFPEDDSVIQSPKYKPFTYKEFQAQVQQDNKILGFKVGLDRFRLNALACQLEPKYFHIMVQK